MRLDLFRICLKLNWEGKWNVKIMYFGGFDKVIKGMRKEREGFVSVLFGEVVFFECLCVYFI